MRLMRLISSVVQSSFINKSKNTDTFTKSLRLIFERNNKISSSSFKFGTVFKSSKWTDLLTINIKNSFMDFKKTIIFILLTVLLINYLSYILNLNPTSYVLHNLATIIFGSMQLFIDAVLDYMNLLILLVFSIFRSSSNTVSLKFNNQLTTPKLSTFNIESLKHTNTTPRLVGITKTTYTTRNNLDSLTDGMSFGINDNGFDFDVTVNLITLPKNITDTNRAMFNLNNLNKNTYSYYRDLLLSESNLTNQSLSINLNVANRLDTNRQLFYDALNIEDSLRLAKSSRWVFRQSLLSPHIIKNTNAYVQTKKLLNYNLFNSSLSKKNIWSSVHLSNMNDTKSRELLAILGQNFTNKYTNSSTNTSTFMINPSLKNFDTFDTGRLWTNNRYALFNNSNLNWISYDLYNQYKLDNNTTILPSILQSNALNSTTIKNNDPLNIIDVNNIITNNTNHILANNTNRDLIARLGSRYISIITSTSTTTQPIMFSPKKPFK